MISIKTLENRNKKYMAQIASKFVKEKNKQLKREMKNKNACITQDARKLIEENKKYKYRGPNNLK